MERIIMDLHGNIFKLNPSEATIASSDIHRPPEIFSSTEIFIHTRDLVTNYPFILVKFGDQYGYIFYINDVSVYGTLDKVGYEPKNDIRSYGKIQNTEAIRYNSSNGSNKQIKSRRRIKR